MPSLPPLAKRLGPLILLVLMFLSAGCETAPAPAPDPSAATLDRILAGQAANAEQAGDPAGAARHYITLYRNNRNDPAVIEGLARSLRHAGDLESARALLAEAVGRLGPQSRLLVEQGKADIGLGKAEAAVTVLRAAMAAAPEAWEPPATLAVAFDRLGRFDEAAAHYRVALTLTPDTADIYNNYALSRALAGRLDEAKALLRIAVGLPDAGSRVRENLAFLESLQRRPSGRPVRVAVPPPQVR
ncbi:MAG: tetratricopeptide repeat protein [Rhodospirillaceae bacterium]